MLKMAVFQDNQQLVLTCVLIVTWDVIQGG